MEINTFFDERTWTLTYVVWDGETRDAVIIDPVLDFDPANGRTWTDSVEEVLAFVKAKDLDVKTENIRENHLESFVQACLGNGKTWSPFSVGGVLTQVLTLEAEQPPPPPLQCLR